MRIFDELKTELNQIRCNNYIISSVIGICNTTMHESSQVIFSYPKEIFLTYDRNGRHYSGNGGYINESGQEVPFSGLAFEEVELTIRSISDVRGSYGQEQFKYQISEQFIRGENLITWYRLEERGI